jgi:hypothetical protein
VQHAKVVAVSTKDNFRRPVPKTFSYRYEVAADAGPNGQPLVRAGAAIIESRYRGRAATWTLARSPVSEETYTVRGGYVHPSPENPMAYPPRTVPEPPPVPVTEAAPQPAPARTERFDSTGPLPAPRAARPAPTPRRSIARPTPANEPAYR